MRRIKNKPIFFLIIFLGIFAFAANSLAALNVDWPNSPFGTELRDDSITELIKYLYEWGFGIAGISVFIVLLVAGIQYLTSAGNASKMGEAMSRIKSAILGLILLLASVLILNTINPQLTTLRMPILGPVGDDFGIPLSLADNKLKNCENVTLYSDDNFNTEVAVLMPGTTPNLSLQANSIKFGGDCLLILYSKPGGNYIADDELPALMITGVGDEKGRKIKNIGAFYGVDMFYSAKLSNAEELVSAGTCSAKACLYENVNFNATNPGWVLPIFDSISRLPRPYNEEATSIRIGRGYAAILHDYYDFGGSVSAQNNDRCFAIIPPQTEAADLGRTVLGNDAASSITSLTAIDDQTIIAGAARLCQDATTDGGCWAGSRIQEISASSIDLVAYDNDASRIELLPGYAAVIYEYANLGGPCTVINNSTDFSGGYLSAFNNRVSSIQIIRTEAVSFGSY